MGAFHIPGVMRVGVTSARAAWFTHRTIHEVNKRRFRDRRSLFRARRPSTFASAFLLSLFVVAAARRARRHRPRLPVPPPPPPQRAKVSVKSTNFSRRPSVLPSVPPFLPPLLRLWENFLATSLKSKAGAGGQRWPWTDGRQHG